MELASILDMPNNLNDEDLEELVVACGPSLIVREGVVLFVHQSAKDFLLKDKKLVLEPASQNFAVLCRSLEMLTLTLSERTGFPILVLLSKSTCIRRAKVKMF